MDDADYTTLNLEMNGWGLPLPLLRKQEMNCPSCGAQAIYYHGQVHCTDLCNRYQNRKVLDKKEATHGLA